ncbi:MAG: NAD(P)H-binding protein, partial [Ilumatobacteraceae bacterium]
MSQRVLVTGGSGYLGRRTIPKLVDAGFEVVALARTTAAADVVHSLGAEVTRGDLEDATSLIGAFQAARADVLLNIASLGFGHAATIVAACTAAGIRRAVFVSTTAIFTRLNAGSKQTRVAAEGTIAASGLDYTIIRPTMIYGGADDRNIARLSQLVRRTRVVPLPGGGARLQQPVHVEDLASALVACLVHSDSIGLEINVAGPEPLTLKEVVKQTASSHQRRVTTVPLPLSPIIALTRLYERASRKPRLKAEQFERLAEDKSFDISTARRVLGYEPRSFAAGLRTDSARQAIGESPTRSQRLGRYVRTISHLRPQQVFARIRLRTQRAGIRCAPRVSGQLLSTRIHPSGDAGWPPTFEPLDRQRYGHVLAGEDILTGRFTLLNRTEVVSNESIWTRRDPPQLWRFHLHYWDWAWGLIALGDRGAPALAELWHDWARRIGYGRGDAWSPYVVSLRLWTLCGLHSHLDAASDLQAELADSIRAHAAHLRSNV